MSVGSSRSTLDTIRRAVTIVKQNGGLWNSVKTLYRIDDLKDGELVGVDRNGNKYYQNTRYFVGRSRWVIYNEKYGLDYDGSQVDPLWHGWLHYVRDDIPKPDAHKNIRKFVTDATENKTGTVQAYVPYSTMKSKIESWQPPQPKKN